MAPEQYSISELSDMTGIPVRTIRSYIQQGLIPRPTSLGRGARYSENALDRLFAIKAFREVEGVSLEEIRSRFLTLTQRDVSDIAFPYRSALDTEAGDSGTSALDYLQNLKGAMGGSWAGGSARSESARLISFHSVSASVPADESPIDRALSRMGSLAKGARAKRTAKSDPWVRISINPDVEIHIRESVAGADLNKYELLADYIREVLFEEDVE